AASAQIASEEAAASLALAANLRALHAVLPEGSDEAGAAQAIASLDGGRVVARLAEGLTAIALTPPSSSTPGAAPGAAPGSDGGWSSDGSERGGRVGVRAGGGGESSDGSERGGRMGVRVGGDASWGKVVLNALKALLSLAKMQPKVFHPHWALLLPGDQLRQRTLLTLVLGDPNPKVRSAAAAVLQALVQRSKAYMAAAEDRRG
ncbi:hypothetical protein T484DRAFT_1827185, partial [Baffinella frigidus]